MLKKMLTKTSLLKNEQQHSSLFVTLFVIFIYQSIVHSRASSSVKPVVGLMFGCWMEKGPKPKAVKALTCFPFPSTATETNRRSVAVRSRSALKFLKVLCCSSYCADTVESRSKVIQTGGSKDAHTSSRFWIPWRKWTSTEIPTNT